MNKFTRLFIDESRVYIPGLAAIIGRLSAGCPEELDLREGRRLSHSIKGMALYEEQADIAALTWAMERGFEKLSGTGTHDTLVVDLARAVAVLPRMIDEVEKHGAPQADAGGIVAALEANL
ncbi:MAG: Hpt domain-containing protein [Candidatus Methylomirabilia bacterium]